MMAQLELRKDKLRQYRKLTKLDTDQQFATAIGVNAATVSRVLSGTSAPGARFIAGLVDVFGVELFGDLFNVLDDAA
ncbi:helix-turn-helix domain-containing protein [Arthrobacter cryoconiti]|uniref:Helix-turn-helix domain-containing protein n=1 Tax=Arthrobacter cryoconiti TaxID=748907 RepID=A0ABV8QXL4_9MICC|nr:helix-turn-helix transcriptional regulator [Arthrobacter cryoconiti]MCC9068849.1 helix-turn-helix transcriptional regulator [Arthrobacter cryoconiti]